MSILATPLVMYNPPAVHLALFLPSLLPFSVPAYALLAASRHTGGPGARYSWLW